VLPEAALIAVVSGGRNEEPVYYAARKGRSKIEKRAELEDTTASSEWFCRR
jgi:hypothetical protein